MASSEHVKNPDRVAAGLRASIKNPRVSDEAKAHATERLHELESKQHTSDQSGAHEHHVLGGYKAALRNQNTSDEAKKHAQEILDAAGIHEDIDINSDDQQHKTRVLAGYKAALHNPKVSEEAKQHARDYLKDHETSS